MFSLPLSRPHTVDEAATFLARLATLLFPFLLFIGSAGAEIALSLTAVCYLLHSALARDWRWLHTPWLRCLALLWAYMLLRALFAESRHEALHRSLPFVRYFVFAAALAYWVMRDAAMRRAFLISLMAGVLFIMGDGLFQYLFSFDMFGRDILPDAAGHVRLTGPFGQTKPIMGVMLAWLSFPVALHLLMDENGRLRSGQPLLMGIAFAVGALCMIALSGERMALLLALLGWFIALLMMRVSKRLLLAVIVAGAVALGCMAVAIPALFERQVTTTIATFAHWQESPYGKIMASDLQLARRNPVFGLGANHFRIACPTLYPNADKDFLAGVCNIHPHNIFLEWLIEEGVIGLGLFLAFAFLLFRSCARTHLLGRNPLLTGWCIAFALRIWPVGSTTGFFSNWGAPPFWLAVGMLVAYTLQAATEKNGNDSSPLAL